MLDLYFGEGMRSIWTEDTSVEWIAGRKRVVDPAKLARARVNHAAHASVFYIPAHRALTLRNGWPRHFGDYALGDPFVVREFSDVLRLLLEHEPEVLARAEPNSNRWDYGIGLPTVQGRGEAVLWLEVHHASSGEAKAVIKKLEWLQLWLREQAPRLDALRKTFVWQLSNVEHNPNDTRRRTLLAEQYGLKRAGRRLRLADYA